MLEQIVRGPLLLPQEDGRVVFHADGALASDARGILVYAGAWEQLHHHVPAAMPARRSEGVMLPPLIDIHTHIPQHPIRGKFVEGIGADPPGGRLLAGLKRNVFPAEAKCAVAEHARVVVEQFLADTLSHGVVGGAAFMTPSALATEIAGQDVAARRCIIRFSTARCARRRPQTIIVVDGPYRVDGANINPGIGKCRALYVASLKR